jgi:transcriptional regulator with XRE-family HTH domain
MNPMQCRMARAALGIGVSDLAQMTNIDSGTISRFEAGEPLGERAIETLLVTFQSSGIVFLDGAYSGSGGPGVRLAAPSTPVIDTNPSEVIQYPEFLEGDGGPGSGG